jgi:tRNA A-37 threonylcarbamoyl transferase component Bud32
MVTIGVSEVPVSASTPEHFGKYQLLEKIATGGMAEVYRARAFGMAGFEKILVIKRVLDHMAKDQEFIEMFIDEARIAVQLQHVNIVQVFDLGEVDGHYFMAMEYVHGIDLSRLLSRSRGLGPFPIPLALFITGEILKALQFAHQQVDDQGRLMQIVHCDVSPQNMLLSYAGEVKILDFGIARAAFQADTKHQIVRGKYAYMSPEQVEGSILDGRSDMFSLGIVLYEMLTGRRLFKMKSRDETLARVRRAEVPSPRGYRPEISEELEGFLLRVLSRDREDRFEDGQQMYMALTRLMVREGHRATNNDMAAYLKEVIEAAAVVAEGGETKKLSGAGRAVSPSAVVCMAVEASPPPRSVAAPTNTLVALGERWANVVSEKGGEIWERGDGSLLVVWVAGGGFRDAISRAISASAELQVAAQEAGYQLSVGIAPGVVRIQPDTARPSSGWVLAGPFYLARWLMNFSAHRGATLLTEVAARHVEGRTSLLGRIPIQGSRFINLYEMG